MSEFVVHSRREAVAGLLWLSVGAALSLALEVVYLGAGLGWLLVPVAAFAFNAVLAKTARLWSDATWVGFIPLGVWVLGYFAAMLAMPALGFSPVPQNLSAVVLLMSGIVGGVYPLARGK